MVLGIPKLFTKSSDRTSDIGIGASSEHGPPRPYSHQYDYYDDDDTIGDNTVNSEGTYAKSILRNRRSVRNNARTVSWSHTFDTYEEGGGDTIGGADTFETLDTLDTIQGRQDHNNGGGGIYQDFREGVSNLVGQNLIRDFNFIYPGETDMSYAQTTYSEAPTYTYDDDNDTFRDASSHGMTNDTLQSVSVSSEMDGTVEMHMRPMRKSRPMRPMTPGPMMAMPPPPPPPTMTPRQVERKQMSMPPPPPPPTMGPRQVERKQIFTSSMISHQPMATTSQAVEFRNLACVSNLSDGTMEMMKDRYGGMDDSGRDEENDMQVGNNIKASSVVQEAAPGVSHGGAFMAPTAGKTAQEGTPRSSNAKEVTPRSPNSVVVPTVNNYKGSELDTLENESAQQAAAEAATKPSDVFAPQLIELPEHVIQSLSINESSTLGSLSMDELTLDDILEEKNLPKNWDMTHVRAASDDESIVTLTKKDHSYDAMFKTQKEADANAGHIGLILPFLDKIQWNNPLGLNSTMFESWDAEALKNDLMKSMSSAVSPSDGVLSDASESLAKMSEESGDDGKVKVAATQSTDIGDKAKSPSTLLSSESSHSEAKVESILMTAGSEEKKSEARLIHSQNDVSPKKNASKDEVSTLMPKKSASRDGETASTMSITKNDSRDEKTSTLSAMKSASNDGDMPTLAAKKSASNDGGEVSALTPNKSASNDGEVTENSFEKNINSIKGFFGLQTPKSASSTDGEVSAMTLNTPKASASYDGDVTETAPKKDVVEEDSNEVKVEEASSENENAESGSGGDVPSDASTEVNSAQLESEDGSGDLSVRGVPVGKVIGIQDLVDAKKAEKSNKKKKKKRGKNEDGSYGLLLPQVVIMDQSTMDILDANNNGSKQQQGKHQWSLWKKKSNKGDSSTKVRDRFNPVSLPPGNVYEFDDDYMSCGDSCVTTESILSELKVIENTAKFMYQRLVVGESDEMGPSHNNIQALFSPMETELVLEPTAEPTGGQGQIGENGEQHPQGGNGDPGTKKKKGGKIGKFFGRLKPKKKRCLGPFFGVSASWTPPKTDDEN